MHAATRRSKHRRPLDAHHRSSSLPGRSLDGQWSSGVGLQGREPVRAWMPAPASRDVCPSDQQLALFVEGGLTIGDVALIDAHMSVCPSCSARVIEALSARTQAVVPMQDSGAGCLSFQLGTCLAERYLVYRSLGQGGMGEVYEAFDLELQQSVAIKTMRARTCDDPQALQRLAREFDLGRRVQHPNVRCTYQYGVHEAAQPRGAAFPFISMELIDGESIAARSRAGRLGPSSFVSIASALFLGLAAIHRAGVIHRDIKSHNILLRDEPSAPLAIIDFGLAIEAAHVVRDARADASGSSAFSPEGSPAYMAPEQFNGFDISFASDVFSCGVVLFQVLMGGLPFRSLSCTSRAEVRRDPREVPRRVREIAPALPAWVDEFVGRCLELNAAARYADATQALEALHDSLARG
jgi:eukaryotic-like serine/threonine-protein kinase